MQGCYAIMTENPRQIQLIWPKSNVA